VVGEQTGGLAGNVIEIKPLCVHSLCSFLGRRVCRRLRVRVCCVVCLSTDDLVSVRGSTRRSRTAMSLTTFLFLL
jgi:hypothetical protein